MQFVIARPGDDVNVGTCNMCPEVPTAEEPACETIIIASGDSDSETDADSEIQSEP